MTDEIALLKDKIASLETRLFALEEKLGLNSTSVKNNKFSLSSVIGKGISHFLEHTLNVLTVGNILLTSVGYNTGKRLVLIAAFHKTAYL